MVLKEEVVRAAGLELNRATRTVTRDSQAVQLTGREFQLLDVLMQNYGRILPREMLLDRIWGLESEVSPNNLDAFVRLLRKKIEQPGDGGLIHNIRGVGYKMEAKDDYPHP
jgi:DNA-binding response OmpR family regulator